MRRHPMRFRSAGGCSCRERLHCRSFPASHPPPAASHPRRRNGSGSGKRRPARAAPAAYRASSALCRHGRHQQRIPQCRTYGRRRTALTGKGAMKTDEVCGRPLDPFGYCSAMRAEMQAEEKNPRKNGKEIQKSVNEKARSNVYISENKWKEVRRWMRARFRRKR